MISGVSVILCCYNSEQFLPKTLEAIARQVTPSSVKWEVIVVDNNSNDNTHAVALSEWAKYSLDIALKVVRETRPGLSEARMKGFETAAFEYCLFCDDDNRLNQEFIVRAYRALEQDACIGVVGSRGIEECEVEPPTWFHRWKGGYAVGEQAERTGDVTHTRGFVYGAATVYRRSAYKKLQKAGFQSLLSGRKGASLSAGDDKELCYALRLAGYKIYYIHENTFIHFIPKKKLTEKYLLNMYRGFGSAQALLTLYEYILNGKKKSTSFMWIKDVIRVSFALLGSLRQERMTVRMRWALLTALLKMAGTYESKYKQILNLKDSVTREG